MFKRIKRLIALSKKDPEALQKLEKLSDEDLAYIPNVPDGKAVFFSQGSQQDFEEFQKEESGMKGWYERLKNFR